MKKPINSVLIIIIMIMSLFPIGASAAGQADLIPYTYSLTMNEDHSVTANVCVKNNGNAGSGQFVIDYHNVHTGSHFKQYTVANLNIGGVYCAPSTTIPQELFRDDSNEIWLTVDINNQVQESDEENNRAEFYYNHDFICTETDQGKDFMNKGETVGLRYGLPDKLTDSCVSELTNGQLVSESPYLAEMYCQDTKNMAYEYKTCENGCQDGKCVDSQAKPDLLVYGVTMTSAADHSVNVRLCVSNVRSADAGQFAVDFFNVNTGKHFHQATLNGLEGEGLRCLPDANIPQEFFADGTNEIWVDLDYNNQVEESIEENNRHEFNYNHVFVCTDSDNGKNYETKGETVGLVGLYTQKSTDTCVSQPDSNGQAVVQSQYLAELYCEGTKSLGYEYKTCEGGCENGRCVQPAQRLKTYFVVDETSSAESVRRLSNLISYLTQNGKLPHGYESKLNQEVDRTDLRDRLVVFLHDDNAAMIVGSTAPAEDVALAAFAQFFLENTYSYSVMNLIDTQVTNDNLLQIFYSEPLECSDSDGGFNLNKQGSTTGILGGTQSVWLNGIWYSPGTQGEFKDSCGQTDSDWVTELYCSNDLVQFTKRFCANGCESGACKSSPSATQTLTLKGNHWSWVSFNVLPTTKTIRDTFGDSLPDIRIIKTGDGPDLQTYYPDNNQYEFSSLYFEKSYKIYAEKDITLTITGEKPRFTRTTQLKHYSDERNMNFIGYPYQTSANIKNFFAPIMDKVLLVKGNDGFFIPGEMETGLTMLQPGKGYMVAVSEDATFTFIADPTTPAQLCSDSDGGKNYITTGTTKGYYNGMLLEEEDSCLTNNDYDNPNGATSGPYVGELFCSSMYNMDFVIKQCESGCQNGACIDNNEVYCSDSDGGRDYDTKGSVQGRNTAGDYYKKDYCESKSKLIEYFCGEGTYGQVERICPHGCSDGACIPGPNQRQKTLFVVDQTSSAETVRDMAILVAYLQERQSLNHGFLNKLNQEVTRADLKNRLTVFMHNGKVAPIVGSTAPSEDVRLGGLAQTYLHDNYGYLVYSRLDTQVLSDDLLEIFGSVDEHFCKDYDGGRQYYEASYVAAGINGEPARIFRDYCSKENIVSEYYCKGNEQAMASYTCEYGCQNGACRRAPPTEYQEVNLNKKFNLIPGSTAQVSDHYNMLIRLNGFIGSTATRQNEVSVSQTANIITANVVSSSGAGSASTTSVSGGSGSSASSIIVKAPIPIDEVSSCPSTYTCPDGSKVPYCNKIEIEQPTAEECSYKYPGGITKHPGSYQTILSKERDYILRFWNGHDENGYGRGLSAIYFGSGTNHANAHLPGFQYTGSPYPGHVSEQVDIQSDVWIPVKMQFDGGELSLNVNRDVKATTKVASTPTHSSYDLYIGSHVGGQDGFIGAIDNVKITNLETGEVVLDMPFDEGDGRRARDLSGNSLHGEIIGAEYVPGVSGTALFFDRNSYVRISDNPKLKMGKFLLEASIKIPSRGVEVCQASSGGSGGGCICRENPQEQCDSSEGVNIDVWLPETSDSIILHRDHLYCANDKPVESSPNKGLNQVFPVGPGTNYWNYKCKNRKQEQCYDDGSFDTYYREWCEYPDEMESSRYNIDLKLGQEKEVFGSKIRLLDVGATTATFVVTSEPTQEMGVDVGIEPRTQTVDEGDTAQYTLIVKDKRTPTRCTSATRCGPSYMTYQISVVGLPFRNSYESRVTLAEGEKKEIPLKVMTNYYESTAGRAELDKVQIESSVIDVAEEINKVKFQTTEEASRWCINNIESDSTIEYRQCVSAAMINEVSEQDDYVVTVSPTAGLITGNVIVEPVEEEEVAMDKIIPTLNMYRFAVKARSLTDSSQDVAYGTLGVRRDPDVSDEYAIVYVYEKIYEDTAQIAARVVKESGEQAEGDSIVLPQRRLVGRFMLPKQQPVSFEDVSYSGTRYFFSLNLVDVKDESMVVIDYRVKNSQSGYKGSMAVEQGREGKIGSSGYIIKAIKVVDDGINPPEFPDVVEEKISINLKPGWNLVSLSGNKLTRFIGTDCSTQVSKLVAFVYMKDIGKYVSISEAQRLLGDDFYDYLSRTTFWIYSYSDCKLTVGVETYLGYNELSLKEGWNMIPVTSDMIGKTLSEVASDCQFRQVYVWDTDENAWDKIDGSYQFRSNMRYTGFVAQASSYCQLGGSLAVLEPPVFPNEAAS